MAWAPETVTPVTWTPWRSARRMRGRAVAAADVADRLARGEVQPVGHEIDQRLHGRRPALTARRPETVMDVLAPDFAVEQVELVVVSGDGSRGLRNGSGGSFQPADAPAESQVPADLARHAGFGQEALPIGAAEAAGDRDHAVAAHDRVPARHRRQQAEAPVGEAGAVQVGDEPAPGGVALQPAQEPDDIGIRQVMSELRRNDQVGERVGRIVKHVARPPGDARAGRGLGRGGDGAARVQVDALQPDRQASAHGPAMDGAQQVALAARDVEDRDDAIGRQVLSSAIDPVQGGTMGEE